MNVMFKEIRQGDIEKIRARIEKNPAVVNEVFTGKKPLKDIGQSPLQVAVKCGEFEIIDLLLKNGADPDFMEDPSQNPENTSASYFMSMSILHDAIYGVFFSIASSDYERSKKTIKLIRRLLEMGADPNKKTSPNREGECLVPIDTLVEEGGNVLRYARIDHPRDQEKAQKGREAFLKILALLKEFGADFESYFDSKMPFSGETHRHAYLDDFIPGEDEPYEFEYKGKMIKSVRIRSEDINREVRSVFQEFFKEK